MESKKIIFRTIKGGKSYYMQLDNGEKRQLGILKNWKIIVRRDKEKHLMRANNSYWFNHKRLKEWFLVDTEVVLQEKDWKTKRELKTTVWEILEKGSFLHFLSQGFEKQIFLKRELFKF